MKKLLLLLLISFVLFSCEQTEIDNVFESSPEQRVKVKIEELKSKLLSNKEGWYAEYQYDNDKKEALLHFNFKENNRVDIQSSFNEYQNKESTYTLNYTEQLNLVFNTHNVLASFVEGFEGGDFRWNLVSIEQDTITFKSREGNTQLVLKKSDGTHSDIILAQYNIKPKLLPNPYRSYYRTLELDGLPTKYSFSFNEGNFSVSFKYKDAAGVIKEHISKVLALSNDKFELQTPLIINDKEVKTFNYNSANETFEIEGSLLTGAINYGSKAFAIDNAADLFINSNTWYQLVNPSNSLKPFTDQLLNIPGTNHQIQWYVNAFSFALKANYVYSIVNGSNTWVGPNITEYKKLNTDEISLVFAGTNRGITPDILALFNSGYNQLVFNANGFDVIPHNNGNFTFVLKDAPQVYFDLIK